MHNAATPRAVLLVQCSCAVAGKKSGLTLFGAFKQQLRKDAWSTAVTTPGTAESIKKSNSSAIQANMKIFCQGPSFVVCSGLRSEHTRSATCTSVLYIFV